MRRFLIFGLAGPAASFLFYCVLLGRISRWGGLSVTYLPMVYAVELVPFLLFAAIDRALENARVWERLIVAGIGGFSIVALPLALFGLPGPVLFGAGASVAAIISSLLATATDHGDFGPIADANDEILLSKRQKSNGR